MSAGLNLAQLQAVHYTDGACLVLAGAGSGKTRVITMKIAHMIEKGMDPRRIAAITFTNKAASEMRERAGHLIGKRAKDVLICTFHALGVRMVREDGHVLGLKPQFSILDADDVTGILKDASGGTTDMATARQWQWVISKWKNMGLTSEQALAQAADDNERIIATLMARYEERLAAYQSVDFDDLIGMPLRLLRDFPEVRAKWQAALGHVLVDEYQDTNATQYELLKLLVGEKGHFTAVGDDDQSIYGWRGATLDNLKKLPVDYPHLKVIKLEQNYRSTSAILRAANNVIGPNPKLFPKTLFSELGEGEPVRVVDADNEEHEAERTVARIQSIRGGSVATSGPAYTEFRHFAVLYRGNHQARVMEQALRTLAGFGPGEGLLLNLDNAEQAQASAQALQAAMEQAGSTAQVTHAFDPRSDKHTLRVARMHHGNERASIITPEFVHGADYAALAEAMCSGRLSAAWFDSMEPGLLSPGRPLHAARELLQLTPRLAGRLFL